MADWKAKFGEITAMDHSKQSIWWLNGFWEDGAQDTAEEIWKITHLAIEIGTGQRILYGKRKVEVKEGCDLDEMKSHVFLEKMGETLTVRALRKRLKELDIDNNKKMALSEYYLAKYGKTPQALVTAPQGEGASPEELAEAQSKLDTATKSMTEVSEALSEQAALLIQQKSDEAAAKRAVEASTAADAAAKEAVAKAQAAEADLKKAEEELRAAVEELQAQEKAYNDKLESLTAKSQDPNLGTVKKNKAANELAQMKAEDPLPLRKAKITQGAALKRAEKARKPMKLATEAAEAAAAEAAAAKQASEDAAAAAEAARVASEKAKADLEVKVKKCEEDVAAAKAFLEELKAKEGTPHGAIWWMERQMREMQKYMPSK